MVNANWAYFISCLFILTPLPYIHKNRLNKIMVASILFVILTGNRFNGADWLNYNAYYILIGEFNNPVQAIASSPFEWLFSFWMWIFSSLHIPYEIFVGSVALLNIYILFWLVNKTQLYSVNYFFLILFLIVGWSLYHEQLRQALGVGFCVMSLFLFLEKKYIKSFLLLFTAMGFHLSAIFGLFLIYILRKTLQKKGILSISSIFISSVVITIVMNIGILIMTSGLLEYIGLNYISEKFIFYQKDAVYGKSLFNAGLLAYILGFFALWWYRKNVIIQNNPWLSFAWTVAVFWCFLGPSFRIFAIFLRFESYLLIFFPFAVSQYGQQNPIVIFPLKKVYAFLFACTFWVRIAISPGYEAWVDNYQNIYVNSLLGLPLDDINDRAAMICHSLMKAGNNFCSG
jgi:hypothetical protein